MRAKGYPSFIVVKAHRELRPPRRIEARSFTISNTFLALTCGAEAAVTEAT